MTRHHLVPQMYLRHFADERSRITLVDRDDISRSVRTSVKKACAEVGFYDWRPELDPDSPPVDDEMLDPEFVERSLSTFESRAVGPIKRVVDSGQPPQSKEDRYHLACFVAFQIARTRRFREDLSAMATQVMRDHLKMTVDPAEVKAWLKERSQPHAEEDVVAFTESATGPKGPRLVPGLAYAIQQSMRLALITTEALWMRQWTVVGFEDSRLITSDEPVVLWHPEGEPVGPANAPIIWMALGRRHLLEIRAPDAPIMLGQDRALIFNDAVATDADRWIIHHPDDAHLMAEANVGPRPVWGEETLDVVTTDDEVRLLKRFRRLRAEPDA